MAKHRAKKAFPARDAAGATVDPIARRALKRATFKAHLDAFKNEMTGVGTSRSKVQYGEYTVECLLDQVTLEGLFKDNDLARKIVAKPVEDALREGFTLRRKDSTPADDAEDAAVLLKGYRRLMRDRLGGDKLERAAVQARLHGGGGLLIGAKGGGPLNKKVRDEDITEVSYFTAWDRTCMTAVEWYPDGSPAVYHYVPKGQKKGQVSQYIHESRLIFFPGALTTDQGRQENLDWDHSVLQAVYQTLKSFDQMFASTDAMFADASQSVFKLQGLIKSLAEADGEGAEASMTRLALMDMYRSATRAIMLEAGGEEGDPEESFEVVERTTLGTLDKVIQQYYIRLASAAGMPLTVLLGMAPAGQDATGEMDMVLYFNTVDVYRRKALTPAITRIINLLARTLLDQEDDEESADEWEVCWPELARPKPLDVATAENMYIQNLGVLIENQVILPEEAALNLPKIAPSMGLVIDTQSRLKALAEALKEIENREMTGPGKEPEPEVPGAGPKGAKRPAKQSERKTPSKQAKRQV